MGNNNHQHTAVYHIPIVVALDRCIEKVSAVIAWLNLILIAVILLSVVMRYGFKQAMVSLEELTWYLYGAGIMFGLSYGVIKNSHIRVDIIHMRLSTKTQYWIEILGSIFLLLPFIWVVFDHSLEWVWESYKIGESSSSPQGLPYRWMIKSVIPISFFLLGVAAISRLIETIVLLRNNRIDSNTIESGRLSLLRQLFTIHPQKNSEAMTENKGKEDKEKRERGHGN